MKRMKSVVLNKIGQGAKLILADLACPKPSSKTILVKVHSCSLNPIDYKMKDGKLRLFTLFKRNKVVASDFCGEIVALGSEVDAYKVGDLVYGMINPLVTGTCGEYLVVTSEELYFKPKSLTKEESSGLALAGLTVYQALFHLARISKRKDPKVLINGSSGGVGHIAVQMAKYFKSHVTAVCSFRNTKFVRSLGADKVIDYTKEDLFSEDSCYDIIFDIQGNLGYYRAKRYLTPKGCYINTTPDVKAVAKDFLWIILSYFTSRKAKFVLAQPNAKDLKSLCLLTENSNLKIIVDKEYPMENIADAFSYLESSRVRGKLIIRVS